MVYHSYMTDVATVEKIRQAAQELIDRYGDNAIDFAKERAEMLRNSDGGTDLDSALLVLSEVERLSN